MRLTEKSNFYGEVTKKQYIGGNCIKKGGGAWIVCRFKRGLGKKDGGGVFEGGLTP